MYKLMDGNDHLVNLLRVFLNGTYRYLKYKLYSLNNIFKKIM